MALTVYDLPRRFAYMSSGSCSLQRRQLMSNNPFNAYRRVLGPLDERWIINWQMPTLQDADWRDLEGFLSQVDGMANCIRMPDPACKYPFGWATGSNPNNDPQGNAKSTNAFADTTTWADGTTWYDSSPSIAVATAAAKGTDQIHVSGFVASQTAAFKRGDKLEIGGLLYQCVAVRVPSDSSGEGLITIRPRLRIAAAAEDKVTIYYPTSVFQFASEADGIIERQAPHFGNLGWTLIEVPEAVYYA